MHFFIIFLIGVSGCGQDDASDVPTPPALISLDPDSQTVSASATQAGFGVNFTFSDPNGDLAGGSINFTYNGETYSIALGDAFAGVKEGQGTGSLTIYPSTMLPGETLIPVWLVDAAGLESNTMYFTLILI